MYEVLPLCQALHQIIDPLSVPQIFLSPGTPGVGGGRGVVKRQSLGEAWESALCICPHDTQEKGVPRE